MQIEQSHININYSRVESYEDCFLIQYFPLHEGNSIQFSVILFRDIDHSYVYDDNL